MSKEGKTITVKDHEIAKFVNDLRDIAVYFGDAQQLREVIAQRVREFTNPDDPQGYTAKMLQDLKDSAPLRFKASLADNHRDVWYNWPVFRPLMTRIAKVIRMRPTNWLMDGKRLDMGIGRVKYIDIRIDQRTGHFNIRNEQNNPLTPDMLYELYGPHITPSTEAGCFDESQESSDGTR